MSIRGRTFVVLALLALAIVPTVASAARHAPSCVVPNVKGARLNVAEKRLHDLHCTVGRITGPRTAFVSAESPKPGQRKKRGAKVDLKLQRKPVAAKTTTAVPSLGTSSTGTPVDTTASSGPSGIPGTWHLALDSEFNGKTLPTDWRTGWFGSGVTGPINTSELDCYDPSHVTFPGDGTMHLVVSAQSSTCNGTTEPYTAALVNTDPSDGRTGPGFQYTYGVLEARIYLPAASNGEIANWPAFWAGGQNWPTTGEDDVMEGLGGSTWWSFHNAQGLRNGPVPGVGPGWHTFATDWEPGSLTYYYDGVAVETLSTGITSAPMYIVLGYGVSSAPYAVTQPGSMQVQYVRVWQH